MGEVRARQKLLHQTSQVVAALVIGLAARVSTADDPQPGSTIVRTISGERIQAQFLGISEHQRLKFSVEGRPLEVGIDELDAIEFSPRTEAVQAAKPGTFFYTAAAGCIGGEILRSTESGIVVQTPFSTSASLRFDNLSAICFTSAEEYPAAQVLFDEQMQDPLTGKDVLITRSANEPKKVSGTLVSLDQAEGRFAVGGRERTFKLQTTYGLVLAKTVSSGMDHEATIFLIDGTALPGNLLPSGAEHVSVESYFAESIQIPVDKISRIGFFSDRVVFLSDLTPTSQDLSGLIHTAWPVRYDHSASNGPLLIDGTRFERGIGVHARAELTYNIGQEFETFAATIGIDDAVRPRGHVVFRILADGQTLFDSGPVTGTDALQAVSLPISGRGVLTILVDYGEQMDLSDHANWANARFIKPRNSARPSTP